MNQSPGIDTLIFIPETPRQPVWRYARGAAIVVAGCAILSMQGYAALSRQLSRAAPAPADVVSLASPR